MLISPIEISNRPKPKGSSLLEMLVVIALLGMLMMLSVPTFTSLLKSTVDKELDRLTGVVRMVRNESILKRRQMRVVFDLQENSYVVEEQVAGGGYSPRADPKILRNHVLDERLKFVDLYVYGKLYTRPTGENRGATENLVPVVIDASGLVDPFYLHLVDGDQVWTVKAAGLTGKISVEEGYVEPRE